ncbi:protein of unknown function [Acetoanaerobium sticklandii]|uniref:Uncharacterized protein n=1 Tax=Acetoanaerobium sticklandii (strain ATCC 12662 / DSM 519 / JCM 1433 / CCUG 9281 / NCIMB 10654 / HF) TaxID=499177 RepID=E3PY66_ACESD|nr:hypothetical protein [Acetoanaerobium sticklandii]CBH21381.1 protein of unknown function [Acetoanaerobium sticklandii]
MSKVNVYEREEYERSIIARVEYNNNLDFWDGRNMCNGGAGRHKGITKLRDGRFVIIDGTDWQGETTTAYVVSDREALEEILESGNVYLLESRRFKKLKEMSEELDDMEEEDED